MPTPKWLVVARNEYRVRTGRIRRIRPYFPYLVIGLLVFYVFYLAPSFISQFIDPSSTLAFILSQVALALVEILLFMVFIYFIILPVTYTLREVQTSQLEIFLAAPIKPSDVLLGEFLGQMPFYGIVITVIVGLFTAVLYPLGLGLGQITIIIIVFAVTFFCAQWIGNVFSALLRTKLGATARGKDIGRALAMIIGLPMIAVMYAVMGGGLLEALADPGTSGMVKTILGLLPSSWGAEIIISFASNPGNISTAGFETLIRFGGLVAFFVVSLLLGMNAANRAYSLEPTTFIVARAKPDGAFYNSIKYFGGGGSFGSLLVSVFKDYSRRLENLSKIVYIAGLLVLLNIFLVDPGDAEGTLVITSLVLPLLSAFVVGEVTLRGKESLFIYKKTPSGIGRFVKARLLHGWLIVVPIAAVVATVSAILSPQVTFAFLLANTGIIVLFVAASVVFVLGLSLLNPAFSEKSGNFVINLMIIMQGYGGLFIISLIVVRRVFYFGLYQLLYYFTIPLSWLVGIIVLYLGKRKLSRIE